MKKKKQKILTIDDAGRRSRDGERQRTCTENVDVSIFLNTFVNGLLSFHDHGHEHVRDFQVKSTDAAADKGRMQRQVSANDLL